MAAPVEIEDANWHRSKQLHKECGWKRGDSANANLGKDAPKADVDFSWKFPTIRPLTPVRVRVLRRHRR